MPKISLKGMNLPTSPIRKLSKYADETKAKGIEVIHLNIGQPDIQTPKKALNAIKSFDQKVLAYGPSEGSLVYRQKMCSYYAKHNIEVQPDNILVTTGASEAIIMTLDCITNEGDELIIPEPFYANYETFAAACGVKVISVSSSIDTDFSLPSIHQIEGKISDKTRAIFVCNPNNPTGFVYSYKELNDLADLVKKYDLFLIVDEVYREFVYDGAIHHSVLTIPGLEEHSILVDSMSKRYSMCGARIGCLVSKNRAVMEAALKFAQSRLSPPALGLQASEAAMDEPLSYLEEVTAIYLERRNTLIHALQKVPGITVSKPRGAFYCLVQLPVEDTDEFAKWLLTSYNHKGKTIMVAPASGFYGDRHLGKSLIRIAFVLEKEKLKESALILEDALHAYPHTQKSKLSR
jgi:aspartate aminotransferase